MEEPRNQGEEMMREKVRQGSKGVGVDGGGGGAGVDLSEARLAENLTGPGQVDH